MFQILKNSTLPHISLEVHLYTHLKFSSSFSRQLKSPSFLIRFADASLEQSRRTLAKKRTFSTSRHQSLRVFWGNKTGSFLFLLHNNHHHNILLFQTFFAQILMLMCLLNLTTAPNHHEKVLHNLLWSHENQKI